MSTKVAAPPFNLQIVDSQLKQLLEFNTWVEEVNRSIPIIGTDSPETFVAARQGQLYIDEDGGTGTILYVKKQGDISGDDTQGWILV